MRVLFLTSYPIEAPSTRYRATQYFRFLERDGFSCELWPFMPSGFYHQFYRKGSAAYKSVRILAFSIRRLLELFKIGRFDIVVVQREAMLIGPPIVEWIVARVWQKPLVFDFDDTRKVGMADESANGPSCCQTRDSMRSIALGSTINSV